MQRFVSVVGVLGLTGSAQAHVSDMPVALHLAEHGWPVMALIALVVVMSPMFRRR